MQLQGYELPSRALAAAVTHAAKKDVRYYLVGVLLDFRLGRIVATDGARMFVGAIPSADCDSLIMPRAQAESILKASKAEIAKGYALALSIGDVENQHRPLITVTNVFTDATFLERAIDGQFPDYDRVLPSHTLDVAPGNYNAQYMLDAQRALAIYEGRDVKRAAYSVRQHGTLGPCLITGVTSFCVVVPMRADEVDPVADLAWFHKPPKKAA